jgi:hypothetical protein
MLAFVMSGCSGGETDSGSDSDTDTSDTDTSDTNTDTDTDTDTDTSDTGSSGEETLVFVSSQKYDGNLGGLIGADAKCQSMADTASLGGSWMAWLGDGVDGPVTRFVHAETGYRLVGGGLIAENFPDLIDGTIGVPINNDETGTPLPSDDDMIVWTAVFHTGGEPTPVNCSGWTAAENSYVPTGLATSTDTGWTVTAPYNCSEFHRIYCFEQ